jgi:Arc/MetJ family transcription regulator
MRTTLDIDPHLLEEAEKLSGEKSASKAVNRALEDLVRKLRAQELIDSLGTWRLELDDWYEFRHQERT